MFFLFKQKTAYEMRISDWSSDVCSSDLRQGSQGSAAAARESVRARLKIAHGSQLQSGGCGISRGGSRIFARASASRSGTARKSGLPSGSRGRRGLAAPTLRQRLGRTDLVEGVRRHRLDCDSEVHLRSEEHTSELQ